MTVEWLTRAEDLASVETPWRELEDAVQTRTHVSTFDFLYPWYRHYAGDYGGQPLIGLAWRGRTLAGVAPLTVRQGTFGRVPITRVDFAPNDSIAGEFLIQDDEPRVAASLLGSLTRRTQFDLVSLNGFDPASGQLRALQDAAELHQLAPQQEGHAYARVDLRSGYAAYRAALPGDFRRKLAHRARKIDEAGGARLHGVLPGLKGDDAEDCLHRMIAITEASYKLEGRPLAPHHRAFLAELVHRLSAQGRLGLPILSIGGRDAAFILGVIERGCFYDVTLSYGETFAKLGPGTHLMQATLEHLASAGIRTLISHGAHDYKRVWSTEFVPQTRLLLFAPTLRAAAARFARFRLQPILRRAAAI